MIILRIAAVKGKTGNKSHASIYNAIREGLFTKSVKIGERAVGWPESEVDAINAARISGKTETEIKELVQRLHLKRTELANVFEEQLLQRTAASSVGCSSN
jgi:prophage regulatory protein